MIDIATRDLAIDQVGYNMIDVLHDWISKEKINLEGFIAHPEGHIDYNPYLVFDIAALQQRVVNLGQIEQALFTISSYKKSQGGVTRAMHDFALDQIPAIIWMRLYEWTDKRAVEMENYIANPNSQIPLPINDYKGLVSFNTNKFLGALSIYRSASNGLAVILQYLKQ